MQIGGVDCLMLPWQTDEVIAEWLRKTKDKIVFGHFGVDGALVSGTEYVLSLGLSPKLFDHHRYTYLGHYHKAQKTRKWCYIGSLHKVDFGERNDKKGFYWVEASKTKISHKFINVKDRPFFQHTVYDTEDPEFKAMRQWESLKDYVVKLIFIGEEDWFLRFNMSEVRSIILKSLGAHKLFFEHKTSVQNRIRVPEIDASSSWAEGIEVYCKKMKRPEMMELGKSILGEIV